MPRPLLSLFLVPLALLGAGLASCGGEAGSTERTLRIYVSQPTEGGRGGEDTIEAVRIAVDNAGGRIDGARIEVVGLNDAREDGRFDPALVRRNARRAAGDNSAIAYIGEFDSGATELAMPILNRAGLLHISSGATAVYLTDPGPGADRGLRPTGIRTFGRVVPNDRVQAAALALFMQEESVERVYVIDDRGAYGTGLREGFLGLSRATGIRVAGTGSVTSGPEIAEAALDVAASGAQALLYAGSDLRVGRELLDATHRADPYIKLFGGDGLALDGFLSILGPPEPSTYITAPMLPQGNYAESGRRYFETFRERNGRDADAMSIFGYEAGLAAFDSIRAGTRGDIKTTAIGNLRRGAKDAFLGFTNRASPLGSYSIDRNGDTTLSFYGAYRVRDGQLVLGRSIDVPSSLIQELER